VLAIKCGVESEDNDLKLDQDWPVLVAKRNPSVEDSTVLNQFKKQSPIHIFSSQSAVHFVAKTLEGIDTSHCDVSTMENCTAVGVGSATDSAAKGLQAKMSHLNIDTVDLRKDDRRENGLNWTLERLEHMGLIPRHEVILWTKTWSVSERLLNDFRSSRRWHNWIASTVEIYSLEPSAGPIPVSVITALAQSRQVCFSVKSGEVLDATIAALLAHLHKPTARDLPQNILFSVWEKSALARAQQLYIQSRLIPAHEFDAALSARDTQQ